MYRSQVLLNRWTICYSKKKLITIYSSLQINISSLGNWHYIALLIYIQSWNNVMERPTDPDDQDPSF